MKRMIYIIVILLLFGLMYWLNKDAPIQYQWEPTFETNDKEPFGAYAFDKILEGSWTEAYYHNYYSLDDIADVTVEYLEDENEINNNENSDEDYDQAETQVNDYLNRNYDNTSISPEYSLLIIADDLDLDSTEVKFLLKYVEQGGTVILAANRLSYLLEDTLNITVKSSFYMNLLDFNKKQTEEKVLFYAQDSIRDTLTLPQPLVKNYFEIPDTVNYTYYDSLYRISTVSDDKTISIRYAIGEGSLILIANPLIFTNYGILSDSINPYIWKHLAYLKDKPLMRTEYYEAGSQGGKSQSEFRVILRERAFKWAYYTIIVGVLVFMIFTAKRKQKIIPVIKPPVNKMLDFVRSIAGLYLLKNNNADLILKKQVYLGEELKRKYGIDIVNEQHDYEFYKRVAAKTQQPVEDVRRLFIDLSVIDEKTFVPDDEMMRLVAKMNEI